MAYVLRILYRNIKGFFMNSSSKLYVINLLCSAILLVVLLPGLALQKESKKKLAFVMIPKGVNPYFDPCFEGFHDAGLKYNVNVEMISPPKFDLALQVEVIEDQIAQKVDGIAISAVQDSGLSASIDKAIKSGIKVITFDAPAPSTRAMSYVGTDNYQAGYQAGKKLISLFRQKSGEIAVLQGGIEAANLNLRVKGLKQALSDMAPNIRIMAVEDTTSDYAIAVSKTEELIKNYQKLKAIIAVSAYEGPAAALAVKECGRKDIIIGGFDDLKDTLKGIRNGDISFTIVQSTYKMGWLSFILLLDLVNNKSVPQVVDTGIVIVDKNNIDSYALEMRKIIDKY